jgi:perosamine synthetase
LYTIFLNHGGKKRRERVRNYLNQFNIETRPVFFPIHVMPPYYEKRSYPVADLWADRGISLPTYQGLSKVDVEKISKCLIKILKLV